MFKSEQNTMRPRPTEAKVFLQNVGQPGQPHGPRTDLIVAWTLFGPPADRIPGPSADAMPALSGGGGSGCPEEGGFGVRT